MTAPSASSTPSGSGHTLRTIVALVSVAAKHGRLDLIRAIGTDIGGRMNRVRGMVDGATREAIKKACGGRSR